MKQKNMTAEEMERLFDEGDERYLEYFDMENAVRLGDEKNPLHRMPKQQKLSVSLPEWMITLLDNEANRLGVTRQAIIKLWLDEKLKGITA
jgi:hypothetical protein